MLEAIHLLLAIPLFVVVVAVDPRWLLRAIAAHYRDLLQVPAATASPAGEAGQVDPDDEELWNSTPAQYLEKIFQVVLTLPPLDTSGYQRLLRSVVGTLPGQDPNPPDGSPPATTAAAQTGPGSPGDDPAGDPGPPKTRITLGRAARLPAARVIERVDPLTLEPDELALLDLLARRCLSRPPARSRGWPTATACSPPYAATSGPQTSPDNPSRSPNRTPAARTTLLTTPTGLAWSCSPL